jgi:phage virion morphogenesis protein
MKLRIRTKKRERKLLQTLRRLEKWQPTSLVLHLARFALERARARITKQKTAPDGSKWPAWSPRYAAWRAKHAPKGGILLLSGKLEESLKVFEQTSGQRWHKVKIGSDLPYAAAHNSPRENKRPKRQYLGLSEDDANAIRQKIAKALRAKVKR